MYLTEFSNFFNLQSILSLMFHLLEVSKCLYLTSVGKRYHSRSLHLFPKFTCKFHFLKEIIMNFKLSL